ncbi:CynX/NimT family MFS transporter [Roseicella sp. DB1501]|uniref:MFS transporter n=1 Tax=Roseicella sp. DB1501 TaxID=2730925 RepID=UPI0014913C0C|nr:MFS transporter [Roseicella sp. DB1501]NOG71291.1 MFS transporter [Roseicella sp. DB1501]
MEPRWLALAVLTLARTSMGFQFQSLASAGAPLVADLGLSYADLGALIGLYFLPGLALALPGGLLGRRFGDKRIVVLGLALMTIGGAVTALAGGQASLAAGRLLSGLGAVLLNVLMAKMVTDWFAGREITLAMTVFVNSFPIGLGLALLVQGGLAASQGWRVALGATALAAAAALLLVLLGYRRHPNDRGAAGPGGWRIPWREAVPVSLAGAMWGIVNGAFTITAAFLPLLLIGAGRTPAAAGSLVGLITWISVAAGQVGGILAQRPGWRPALLVGSYAGWAACLLLLPLLPPEAPPLPVLLLLGLVQGLPVGVIMAMPAETLRPESRATGMGLFYTWLYLGHAGLPPIAGWWQDRLGGPAAALAFAAALLLACLPLYVAYRVLRRRPAAA